MIDVVIPLGKGSQFGNAELRYCLRSVDMYLKGIRNVYIIGEKPNGFKNIIHIPYPDKYSKEQNIMLKVLAACDNPNVSDGFLFMNDDHFFKTTTDAVNYPNYYDTRLIDWDNGRRLFQPYKQAILNTHRTLINNDLPALHYDIHCPILYNKELFKNVMSRYSWDIDFGYVVKSLYANTLKLKGIQIQDCKINEPLHLYSIANLIQDRHIFSIGDSGFTPVMQELLENLYPYKSRYED